MFCLKSRLPSAAHTLTQAAVCALVFSGCSNIKDDADRTRTEGTLAGAAGGAALGAGAGALAGKKGGAAGMAAGGAAAGALAGGMAGRATGEAVVQKKAGYARTEDALEQQLATILGQTNRRRAYNEKLRGVVAEKQRQLVKVRAARQESGPTVQEFELRTSIVAQLREVDGQARSWQETIRAHKAALRNTAGDPRDPELRSAINLLSAQQEDLKLQREQLSAVGERLGR